MMRSGQAAELMTHFPAIKGSTGRIVGVQDPTGVRDVQWLEMSMLYQTAGTRRYVDFRAAAAGGKGSDTNDGLDPQTPYATMSKALSACSHYDSIGFIGTCTESGLSSSLVGIHIYGMGPQSGAQCIWNPSADAVALTITGKGWVFSNFKVEAPSSVEWLRAWRTSGTANPSDGLMVNLEANTGKYLINASDVDNWRFINVVAHDMGTPIYGNSGEPKRWLLSGCRFTNNDNHVIARLNDSEIVGCSFQAQGVSKTATIKLDLRGGANGRNRVHQCFVGGTFSNAGGYYAGSNDEWGNNWNVGGLRHGNPA